MDIRININKQEFKISGDKNNYLVEDVKIAKKGINKDEEVFSLVGYVRTIPQALKLIGEQEFRNNECTTFEELEKHFETVILDSEIALRSIMEF